MSIPGSLSTRRVDPLSEMCSAEARRGTTHSAGGQASVNI